MRDAGDDFVFSLKSFGIAQFEFRFAARHHLQYDISAQAISLRARNTMRKIAGGNFFLTMEYPGPR